MLMVGIDLAWGERNRDGICLIEADDKRPRCWSRAGVLGTTLSRDGCVSGSDTSPA
jgi:predicted RNase H-like nuclease